ncbi:YbaN family protein [Bacillus testis]|uniref:YbaN family protein n=1 Tax=Bacillus testis TaxID=1622072 RepID=UPI00067ED274|nr:YbaN family protein [Bacillus testis]
MKKIILCSLGWISFALGLVGVVLPVLPTTPFILLTACLFAKSSKTCEAWIKRRKVYRKYVLEYKQNKGLTPRQKAEILGMATTLLLVSGILIAHIHLRVFLAVLAICKWIVVWRFIPTVSKKEVLQ